MRKAKVWTSRIVGHDVKPASWFAANELNFRTHGEKQASGVRGSLGAVGWVKSVIVNLRTSPQWGEGANAPRLLDGHLRVELALERDPETPIPVELVDLPPNEERLALLLLDHLSLMADQDADTLDELIRQVNTDDAGLMEIIAGMAEGLDRLGGVGVGGSAFDEEEGGEPGEPSEGTLLSLVSITIDEPRHAVAKGGVWQVGAHILACCDVMTDWPQWTQFLDEGATFVPYPGPFAAHAGDHGGKRLVMVQPDPYIAGHILDRYAEVEGEEAVKCLT